MAQGFSGRTGLREIAEMGRLFLRVARLFSEDSSLVAEILATPNLQRF
jgi:hypothetical protein